MYKTPSIEHLIEGAIQTINSEIAPAIADENIKVKLEMAVVLLQTALQVAPVERSKMITEHNDLIDVFQDIGAMAAKQNDQEAKNILEVTQKALDRRSKFPAEPSREQVIDAHFLLSSKLRPCLELADKLLTSGNNFGDRVLERIRSHLAMRTLKHDFPIYAVNPGSMPGRK